MSIRTLDNCQLIKKYGKPQQYDDMCEGFGSKSDDPCSMCKGCRLFYINVEESRE